MALEELVAEEKKVKSRQIPFAVLMGILVGIAVWSATHQGSTFLTIGLLVLVPFIGSSYSKNLKGIQEEIKRRDTVH